MKKFNIVETVRLFIMNAQTNRALEELYRFFNKKKLTDQLNQVVLLSSSFKEVEKSERLGLGKYIEEKNRINLSLLKIIDEIDVEQIETPSENTSEIKSSIDMDILSSKIDFILDQIERNEDHLFFGFSKSKLWEFLEEKSRENFINANIIEKELKQNNYRDAITLYLDSIMIELEQKFLKKFKASVDLNSFNRLQVKEDFKGMNKNKILEYILEDKVLSLNQIAEILLSNVIEVEKSELEGNGLVFYETFYQSFKIKNISIVSGSLSKFKNYKGGKYIRGFTQTLLDVTDTKEEVINFFLHFQPRNQKNN